MIACAATPLAASAEPALKPAQPNHRMPVPIIVSGRLCGGIGASGIALALARARSTSASAAAPALMCTTAPPAKSSAPISASQPPANTQCATGAYTSTSQTRDEHRVGAELQPVGRRAGDQRRGDDRERHLERAEQHERDREEARRTHPPPDAPGPTSFRKAKSKLPMTAAVAGVAEREAEHDRHPQDGEDAHGEEVLHEHAEHVLARGPCRRRTTPGPAS